MWGDLFILCIEKGMNSDLDQMAQNVEKEIIIPAEQITYAELF